MEPGTAMAIASAAGGLLRTLFGPSGRPKQPDPPPRLLSTSRGLPARPQLSRPAAAPAAAPAAPDPILGALISVGTAAMSDYLQTPSVSTAPLGATSLPTAGASMPGMTTQLRMSPALSVPPVPPGQFSPGAYGAARTPLSLRPGLTTPPALAPFATAPSRPAAAMPAAAQPPPGAAPVTGDGAAARAQAAGWRPYTGHGGGWLDPAGQWHGDFDMRRVFPVQTPLDLPFQAGVPRIPIARPR